MKPPVPWRTTTQRMEIQDQMETDLAAERFMQTGIIEVFKFPPIETIPVEVFHVAGGSKEETNGSFRQQ